MAHPPSELTAITALDALSYLSSEASPTTCVVPDHVGAVALNPTHIARRREGDVSPDVFGPQRQRQASSRPGEPPTSDILTCHRSRSDRLDQGIWRS